MARRREADVHQDRYALGRETQVLYLQQGPGIIIQAHRHLSMVLSYQQVSNPIIVSQEYLAKINAAFLPTKPAIDW
jgi:hypothetical protein